jgi:hypothetical protein
MSIYIGVPPEIWPLGMLGFPQPEEDQQEETFHGRTDCENFTGCRNHDD